MRNYSLTFLCLVATLMVLVSQSGSSPARSRNMYFNNPRDRPVFHMLAKLGHALMRANELDSYSPTIKRGIDFGLGRSFSGSKAAKHYMGLAAAKFAVGPGRK